jgi:hypothetical protein
MKGTEILENVEDIVNMSVEMEMSKNKNLASQMSKVEMSTNIVEVRKRARKRIEQARL